MKVLSLLLVASVLFYFAPLTAQEDIIPESDFIDEPQDDFIPPVDGEIPPIDGSGIPGNAEMPAPENVPAFNPSNSPSFNSGKPNPSFGGVKKRQRPAPPISQAGVEDITNENYPDLIDSFDFPNADIADVIKAISELTGKNFIVDPNVSGKITIMAPTQITVAEAYKVFLSALAIRGFTVVPSGKFLKILPVRDAQRDNLEIFSGNYTPDTDQMITRILHLKYIPAGEMNKFASKLVSKNGNIDIYEPTNSLIVSDQASSVQRLIKIVNQLDVTGFDEQMVVIPIRYAKAKDIADLIDQIINKGEGKKRGSGFSSGIPRFRPGGSQSSTGGSAFSTVIPDDRTNAIIVVGNKSGIEKIRKLVRTLDFKLNPEDQAGAYVYYVKYGEAEKIADILNGITKQLKEDEKKQAGGANGSIPPPPTFGDGFGNTAPQPTSSGIGGLFGSDVKISADKDTNSLIIVGSKQDYQGVQSLLKKIDIPRDQVYVEAIIMETTASNSDSYGLSYFKFEEGTDGVGRSGFSGVPLSNILDVGTPGAILGFASGDTVKIKVGGQEVTVNSLLGFLNLIKSTTNVDILSTPQVIALDNETAIIEVGENVPIGKTTNSTQAGTQENIERTDATIKLEIKPFISPSSDAVRMQIKQTVKQVSEQQVKAKNLADSAISTINRSVDTNIVVRDGDTAVIGGLMRDQETLSETKVPLLGDIPVLGWLFKSRTTQKEKVNLLVFITPKVIRNPTDSSLLLTKKLDERVQFVKENLGGKDKRGAFAESLRPKLKKKTNSDKLEDEFIDQEAQ